MIFPKPLLLMVSLEHAPAAQRAPALHAALRRVMPAQIVISGDPACVPLGMGHRQPSQNVGASALTSAILGASVKQLLGEA